MVIYVDIDNTICHSHKDDDGIWDYNLSKPRYKQILKIQIVMYVGKQKQKTNGH